MELLNRIKRIFGYKRYNADVIKIKAILHNTGDDAYLIQRAIGLLQGILVPVGALKLLEVAQLTETERLVTVVVLAAQVNNHD